MEMPNLKILLAEHDPWIADAFERFFSCKGCFLVTVNSIQDGVGLLEKERFDVVASEYELSGKKGLQIFKIAKSANPDSVNILITDYGQPDPVPGEFKTDVDGIIEKPFPFEEFLGILAKHIRIDGDECNNSYGNLYNSGGRLQ